MLPNFTPFLWSVNQVVEVANFWASLFQDSAIIGINPRTGLTLIVLKLLFWGLTSAIPMLVIGGLACSRKRSGF